jgi:hypothetical protein
MRISRDRFRLGILGFATLLALHGMWTVAADLFRPKLPFFPIDHSGADKVTPVAQFRAAVAASIGLFRGDLWADYALALGSELSGIDGAALDVPSEKVQTARAIARRAATLAPSDARVWLLLAAIDAQRDRPASDIARPLTMSYYTAPSEAALIPLRLKIAAGLDTLADPELQGLMTRDIRTVINRSPTLNFAIVDAYRGGSPEGRRFIEATLITLDPALLRMMRDLGQ